MAEIKSNAKNASDNKHALKSRGLKNPKPMGLKPDSGSKNTAEAFKGNDGSGKGEKLGLVPLVSIYTKTSTIDSG